MGASIKDRGEVLTTDTRRHIEQAIDRALDTAADSMVSATAAYSATSADDVILCDATTAAFTVTLPLAASMTGRRLIVKKTDASANAVTVDGNGAETIDGAANYALAAQWASVTVQSNGAAWFIL